MALDDQEYLTMDREQAQQRWGPISVIRVGVGVTDGIRGLRGGVWRLGRGIAIALMVLAIAIGGAMGTPVAVAAPEVEPLPVERSQPVVPDAGAVPAEKLDRFVTAYLNVLAAFETQSEALRRAETPAQAERIERDLELAAKDAIEAAGLKLDDYLQLLGLTEGDAAFGDRVAARLQELAGAMQ